MMFITKNAIKILLALLTAIILFHLLILVKVVPYELTWGGRLKSDSEMYVFETFSILINLFLAIVLLMKDGYIKPLFPSKTLHIILWFFVVIFAINTLGNVFAKTSLEKMFTIITFLFSVLIALSLKTKTN